MSSTMSETTNNNPPHAIPNGEDEQTDVVDPENLEVETKPVCRGCSFPYLLIQALIHLGIYIHKLSEDGYTVSTYYQEKHVYYCIVSALCLFIPSLVYTVYLIADSILDKSTPLSDICTKVINGMLLVPWQIKGHVEVLHYAAQRVCRCGPPSKVEHSRIRTLERETFVLEFFEDFYAGFVQILLQVYLIVLFLNSSQPSNALLGQLVGSVLCLYSLIKAVQRRDDGILTRTLSYVGWIAVTTSRGLALSLLTSVIHGWIVVACLLHAAAMTAWITSFVREAHRRLESVRRTSDTEPLPSPCVIITLIFTLFGLPSLVFWPIMFDFKVRRRVFVFVFTFLVENLLCFGAWHLWGSQSTQENHKVVISAVLLGCTAVGVLFIALYSCCKPEKTDLVVLQHIREDNANKYGIYFDFCKVIRILPDTQDIARDLEKIRMLNLTK
ncbi:uncharacterized protein LOC135385659 [Ornithodoros turicata]|uniref:uncharacterized protein LOC135385659 n=1 Tax=Ornithodoros turicata TaxID=34597 RepID=UPI0031393982